MMARSSQRPDEYAIDVASRRQFFGSRLLILQQERQGDPQSAEAADFKE
jgi:hypothetical protein